LLKQERVKPQHIYLDYKLSWESRARKENTRTTTRKSKALKIGRLGGLPIE